MAPAAGRRVAGSEVPAAVVLVGLAAVAEAVVMTMAMMTTHGGLGAAVILPHHLETV